LRWRQRQSQENCGLCIAAATTSPATAPAGHPPGADRDIQVEAGKAGAEVGAGGTFGVPQALAGNRQGGMREEDLARGDRRAQRFGDSRPAAEEGELKADVGQWRVEGAGDVPPFGAKVRVRAVVAREDQSHARPYRCIGDGGGSRPRRVSSRQQQGSGEEAAAAHCRCPYWALARTCATGSRVAWRAA
jgi:hypothetical protein